MVSRTDWLDDISAEMAAGQLFIFGFDGDRYNRRIGSFFEKVKLGGVILFSRNISSAEQTKRLISDLKKLGEDTTGLPLFVCIDQEGGRVARLSSDLPTFPTARSLGEDGSSGQVGEVYERIGSELKNLGFNVDFAPCLDLDTNDANPVIGDRSFSRDPQEVSRLGLAAIEGLRRQKILTCAKHFPGHGDTSLDSHFDLPVDERSKSRFDEAELEPFRMSIAQKVDFIMTAHVIYPAFDKVYPATLSKRIVTDLLREKMGYDGIIIGDDFDMKAVSDRWDEKGAAIAFEAGIDMGMVCHETPRRENLYESVRKSIIEGRISETSVKERLHRIISAKERLEEV